MFLITYYSLKRRDNLTQLLLIFLKEKVNVRYNTFLEHKEQKDNHHQTIAQLTSQQHKRTISMTTPPPLPPPPPPPPKRGRGKQSLCNQHNKRHLFISIAINL